MGETTDDLLGGPTTSPRRRFLLPGLLAATVLLVLVGLLVGRAAVDKRVDDAAVQRTVAQSLTSELDVTRADLDGQDETLGTVEKKLRKATKARDVQAKAVASARKDLRRTRTDLEETRDELERSAKRLQRTQRCLIRASQVLNQVAVDDFFGLVNTIPAFQRACKPILDE